MPAVKPSWLDYRQIYKVRHLKNSANSVLYIPAPMSFYTKNTILSHDENPLLPISSIYFKISSQHFTSYSLKLSFPCTGYMEDLLCVKYQYFCEYIYHIVTYLYAANMLICSRFQQQQNVLMQITRKYAVILQIHTISLYKYF